MDKGKNSDVSAPIDKEQEFISFLRYCAERLDKGVPVQLIWRDYLGIRRQIFDLSHPLHYLKQCWNNRMFSPLVHRIP